MINTVTCLIFEFVITFFMILDIEKFDLVRLRIFFPKSKLSFNKIPSFFIIYNMKCDHYFSGEFIVGEKDIITKLNRKIISVTIMV